MKTPRALPLLMLLSAAAWAQSRQPAPAKTPEPELDLDALYQQGKQLFDDYAPPDVKRQFEFPSKTQWDDFATRLQAALEQNDLRALAAYEPEARAALQALRAFPDYADYADWLATRLDYIEAAGLAVKQPGYALPPKPPATKPADSKKNAATVAKSAKSTPPGPAPKSAGTASATASVTSGAATIPYFDLWLGRVRARPVPARAPELLPVVRAAFAAEGVPAELAWLAEVESAFNPAARSPVGARGLYQFMPATAKSLGLSTWLPDDRADPEKSARAAARYLKTLHGKFRDWPLALAAYNAGEGRVRRLLDAKRAKTFADIAASLPSETRMYVPKVLATLQTRTGVSPARLAAPRAG